MKSQLEKLLLTIESLIDRAEGLLGERYEAVAENLETAKDAIEEAISQFDKLISRPIDVTLHPLRFPPLTVKTQASTSPVALVVAFAAVKRDRLLPPSTRIARISWGDQRSAEEAAVAPNAVSHAIAHSGLVWASNRRRIE